jgi:nitrate reductase delta subunit
LNLFEHLHGESRDRGAAMVDLKRLYEDAGYELMAHELPDYLPVVLEYLSCRDMTEAKELLADCAHIMATIARALLARQSRYAAVLQALLVIAGEEPVDSAAVTPAKPPAEDLDLDWVEQPAFAGAPEISTPATRARPS